MRKEVNNLLLIRVLTGLEKKDFVIKDNLLSYQYANYTNNEILPYNDYEVVGILNDLTWSEIETAFEVKSNQQFIDLINGWEHSYIVTLILKRK